MKATVDLVLPELVAKRVHLPRLLQDGRAIGLVLAPERFEISASLLHRGAKWRYLLLFLIAVGLDGGALIGAEVELIEEALVAPFVVTMSATPATVLARFIVELGRRRHDGPREEEADRE